MNTSSQQVCEEILRLIEYVKRSLWELAEEHGLTPVQVFTLYALDQRDEIAMGQMADVLHCDASNVTGIVGRMVAQGLIVRKAYEQDRRSKKLQLTAKGQEVIKELQAALPSKLNCDKLTPAERESFFALAQKLRA